MADTLELDVDSPHDRARKMMGTQLGNLGVDSRSNFAITILAWES